MIDHFGKTEFFIDDDWLAEMKAELKNKAKMQSDLYNFDFEKDCPGSSTESKIKWELTEKQALGVGVLRPKSEFRKIEIPVLKIAALNVNNAKTELMKYKNK